MRFKVCGDLGILENWRMKKIKKKQFQLYITPQQKKIIEEAAGITEEFNVTGFARRELLLVCKKIIKKEKEESS